MDGVKGALHIDKKITVGNEYAEFKVWFDRTTLNIKMVDGVVKSSKTLQTQFKTMGVQCEKYMQEMEKVYPESDNLKDLMRHTAEQSTKLKNDWDGLKVDMDKNLQAYATELKQIIKDCQGLQGSYDALTKAGKDVEKAKDEAKKAAAQNSKDNKKKEFDFAMDNMIERMKKSDSKRKEVVTFMLGAYSLNQRERSSAFRKHLQHSLNFAINSIDEVKVFNLLDFSAEKQKLSTEIPDLSKPAVVMKMQEDHSWITSA